MSAFLHAQGLIGCEGAQVLRHWARGSDSRSHGSSEVLGCTALACEDICSRGPILRGVLLTQGDLVKLTQPRRAKDP
jgi:hypothetical protein